MTTTEVPIFRRLGQVAPPPNEAMLDLRGGRVFDRAGVEIGVVDDLLYDELERRARLVRVSVRAALRAEQAHVLIPVEAIRRLDGDRVHVDPLRERVLSGPLDDPDADQTADRWLGLYTYYGCTPFWQEAGATAATFQAGPVQKEDPMSDVRQHTEGEGRTETHTHPPIVHSHDHWHVSHHVSDDGQVEHRTYWHTHDHNHSELVHSHDYDQRDEERHHAREAHIHDHAAPAESPA